MARHIVIATAGHVDHGKTTLVKALTGIDTDTMAEEKRRGLTINLGFAYMTLPGGIRAAIVDVPGHERFIKNMVAGLPGIDVVLLVVDANEGVMPQTLEHLDILELLGVRNFLVVLTKADTADEELLALVWEDIRERLAQTAAADADIVETDAVTGRGIKELVEKLGVLAAKIPERTGNGEGRLHVDRVFSVKGFGTVVTGTLLDGVIAVGDDVFVYPRRLEARVRNIQVHDRNVAQAEPGQRTALNLTNVGTGDVRRGDVVSLSGLLTPTRMIDVKLRCLGGASPIRLWDRLRVHVGTQEVMVRAVPLGADAILPGEEGFAQLRLERDQAVVKKGDPFIVRTFSPPHTIGGGKILDANPLKHRRFKDDVLASLQVKDSGTAADAVEDFLRGCSAFAPLSAIARNTGFHTDEAEAAAGELVAQGVVRKTDSGYIHEALCKQWRGKALSLLTAYHKKYPLRRGMAVREFPSRLGEALSERESRALLQLLSDDGSCRVEGDFVAAKSFRVVFSPEQENTRAAIRQMLQNSRFTPVKVADILAAFPGSEEILDSMKAEEILFLSPEYVLGRPFYSKACQTLYAYAREKGLIELAQFRDLLRVGRKAALLILEYMDQQHVTRRVENGRVLDGDCREQVDRER